jgi:hypothetical protein
VGAFIVQPSREYGSDALAWVDPDDPKVCPTEWVVAVPPRDMHGTALPADLRVTTPGGGSHRPDVLDTLEAIGHALTEAAPIVRGWRESGG